MIELTDLEADLRVSSHNQLGKISNLYSVFNRAIRIANQYTDLKGTEREDTLTAVTPAEDYVYTCPSALKENAIIAIYDSEGNTADFVLVEDPKEFDYYVRWRVPGFENIVTVRFQEGTTSFERVLMIYSEVITPYSIKYYSNEYFLSLAGTYKSRATVSTDKVAVDDIYYESLLTTCEIIVSRYNRELSTGDFEFDKMMNMGALKDIWDKYPSDRLNIMGTY